MKVLWMTNSRLPRPGERENGHWMSGLASVLCDAGDIDLGFVAYGGGEEAFGLQTGGPWGPEWTIPLRDLRERHRPPRPGVRGQILAIVEKFKPDVLHIHGTEQNWGLLSTRGYLDVPTVISIQGLLSVYYRYDLGGLSEREALRRYSMRDWLFQEGMLHRQAERRRASKVEAEILRDGRCFVGRTRWDRAYVRACNPYASYFQGEEVMRPAFFECKWRRETARRFTIFTCVQPEPLKGLHVLLKAAGVLRHEFPELRVRIAGRPIRKGFSATGFENLLWNIMKEESLGGNVDLVGPLDAEGLCSELCSASAAVVPSFVENASNSLSEAMLVGIPTVASFGGGLTTTAQDGVSALFFPAGEAAVLAECVRMLFREPELGVRLGQAAREVAFKRHDPKRIRSETRQTYEEVQRQWR